MSHISLTSKLLEIDLTFYIWSCLQLVRENILWIIHGISMDERAGYSIALHLLGSDQGCYHDGKKCQTVIEPAAHQAVRCNSHRENYHHAARWPSGLRRWNQDPVRKGVSSNLTLVKYFLSMVEL